MAQFEKWFTQDLTQPVEIRHCESVVFTGDNLSNLVGVNLYVDGEPYSGGGVVKGNVLLSNGVTVPLTGTLDGNKASIVLTSGCFILPGLVGVSIRIDSGDTKTTVLSAVFTCVQSETDSTIDPGTIIPSVQDLIDDINDAVGSIPPDYSALLATIAPNFSASTAYSAGQYIWNDGTLYRFTVDHAAGAWTGTDAAAAVIGNDLSKTVTVDENSPDWLYEMIFGDTSDWVANPTGTYAGASCTKHGRRFDFVGMGSAAGSTVIWYNLTGSAHRAFSASVTNSTPASIAQDSDYIDIPVKLSNVAGNASRYEVVGCDLLASFTRTSTSEAANQVRLVLGFRRLNTETGEYEYTDSHSLGTSADYRYGGAVRGYIATSQLYDQTSYNAYWTEYEQVAIYLVRYSQRISGSAVLTPVMERFPDTEGVGTVRYDKAQTLTDAQKIQAQENMGAVGDVVFDAASGALNLVEYTKHYETQTLETAVGLTITQAGNKLTIDGTAGSTVRVRVSGALRVQASSVTASNNPSGVGATMIAGHTYAIVGKLVSGSVEYSGNSVYPALYREGTATSEVLTTNANGTNYHARAFISEGYTDLLWLTIVSGTVCNNAVYEYTITDTTQPTSEGLYIADSSATPTINAVPNGRYVCTASAVTELSFTPSASGICSVRFKSGTTPTVLTIPNTVKMPPWWNGCSANTFYEISIADGVYGAVGVWT